MKNKQLIINKVYETRLKFEDSNNDYYTLGKVKIMKKWLINSKWYLGNQLLLRKILEIKMINKNGDILEEEDKR